MHNPFFSVIIPSYNRANFLPLALGSLIEQTFPDWECIVVDDGSIDHTPDVVKAFITSDSRFRYIWQENSERSAARNHGVKVASGKYICFLDSDDTYTSSYLQELHHTILNHAYPPVIVSRIKTDSPDQEMKINPLMFPFEGSAADFILNTASVIYVIIVVCRKDVFENHLFDTRFNIWEDTHLFLRIFYHYPLVTSPNAISLVSTGEQSGVISRLKQIRIAHVYKYFEAIDDLKAVFSKLTLDQNRNTTMFRNYKNKKIQMYLYQARQNRQIKEAFILCLIGLRNDPDLRYLIEMIKSVLNYLSIGIHENQY